MPGPLLSCRCRVGMPPCLLIGIAAPHHEEAEDLLDSSLNSSAHGSP